VQALGARIKVLEAVLDTLLSTLVLRGVVSRAEVDHILAECEGSLRRDSTHATALEQLNAVRKEVSEHIRAAQGSGGDDHDH
jgi:hypothetical protein